MTKQKAAAQAELESAQSAVSEANEELVHAKRSYDPSLVQTAEVSAAEAVERLAGVEGKAKLAACPNYWILKPVGLSRGRGISMISDVGCIKYVGPWSVLSLGSTSTHPRRSL